MSSPVETPPGPVAEAVALLDDAALDLLPIGIVIYDRDGVLRRANTASDRILGGPVAARVEEWKLCLRDGTHVAPEAVPAALVLATGHAVSGVELGTPRDGGEMVWLDICASPLPTGGVVMTYSDVSAHHREEAIREARARLGELAVGASLETVLRATLDEIEALTGSSIGFYHFVDRDENSLTLQAWSTRTSEVFCRAEGKGLHYAFSDAGVWIDAARERRPVIHNDYDSLAHKRGMPEGHARVTRELVVPVIRGGRIVAVLGTGNKPVPYDDRDVDVVQRFADLAWDLVEWKRAEESLWIKDAAITGALNGFVITDLDARVIDVNDAALRMWGVNRSDVLGKKGSALMDAPIDEEVGRVLREGSAAGIGRARRADGSIFYVEYSASLLRDVAGNPARIAVTVMDVTQRRLQERALRESEARFRSLIQYSPLPTIVLSLNGDVQHLNDAFVRTFGYDDTEIRTVEDWWLRLVPHEEYRNELRTEWAKSVEKAMATGEASRTEYRIVCKDGTERIVDRRGAVVGDSWVAIFNDITASRRLEEELTTSAGRFKTLVNTSLDGFMAVVDGVITDANETYAGMLGYTPAELRGMPLKLIEAREDEAEIERHLARIARTGYDRFETLHRTKSGEPFPVECSVMRDSQRNGVLAFIRDLRQEKAAEEQLLETARFLRDAQRAGKVGTYVFDLRDNEWKSSPELDEIFGIGPSFHRDVEGWISLIAPDWQAAMAEYLRELVGAGKPFDKTYEIIHQASGERRWVHGMGEFERDDSGQPVRLLGVIQDISEQQRANEELRNTREQLFRSQKMESLGLLAGGVAHDINNVLAAILGLSTAYADLQPGGTPLREALDTISEACVRGRTTVRALLGFARLELAEERVVDINSIVHDEIRLLERTTLRRVALVQDLEPSLWMVRGDPGALSSALMNLCVNAVDAMPDGGALTLRTRNVEPAIVELVVGDTGTGMPPEVVDRAFDPFFTTKPQGSGTGLGLSIVYGAVRAHGGEVRIESVPSEGTRVIMRFPALPVQKPAAGAEAQTGPVTATKSLRILLVDDDVDVRQTTQLLLTRMRHAVTAAASGEEAIELLETGVEADLVLLDLSMPGIGGAGALRRIRALRPTVPVLISTGLADQRAIDLTQAYAGVSLLQKPFTLRELRSALETIIQG